MEFLKWIIQSLSLVRTQKGISVENQIRMANRVDPDEMAYYELSY